VPQQALFFLNSPFVVGQAQALAAKARGAGTSEEARIQALYARLFSRAATQAELAAGLRYLAQAEAMPEDAPLSPWQYGVESGGFQHFGVFANESWQGAGVKAALRPNGGEPGEGTPVVWRFTSPAKGTLNIEGTLRHGQGAVVYGDGVRARIVSSRLGELASWAVNGSNAETKLGGLAVEVGDTIDFIVDCRQDPENDAFSWAPTIRIGEKQWNTKSDFKGPRPNRLDTWGLYAQVLLQTNEFAFVD